MRVLSKRLHNRGFHIKQSYDTPHILRFTLMRNSTLLAHMKFCSDLDEYYRYEENGFEPEPAHQDLSDRLKGEVGVVEIQAVKYTTQLRENIPYKDILFRAYQNDRKHKPEFILSHSNIFYMNSQVRGYIKEIDAIELDDERMKKNYDRFAQSQGYVLDETLRIFRRPN